MNNGSNRNVDRKENRKLEQRSCCVYERRALLALKSGISGESAPDFV